MNLTKIPLAARLVRAALAIVYFAPGGYPQQTSPPLAPPPASQAVRRDAGPIELALDPARSQIRYTISATLHTVHGTFLLHSGTIRYDPASGAIRGLIVVDAASGQSGNSSRDSNMQRNVLQSARYPEITFVPDRVRGAVAMPGDAVVQVHGVLTLHGTAHEMTLPVAVHATSTEITARTSAVIPYVQWGMKDPSTFFLHVEKQARIDLTLSGRPQPIAGRTQPLRQAARVSSLLRPGTRSRGCHYQSCHYLISNLCT